MASRDEINARWMELDTQEGQANDVDDFLSGAGLRGEAFPWLHKETNALANAMRLRLERMEERLRLLNSQLDELLRERDSYPFMSIVRDAGFIVAVVVAYYLGEHHFF